MGVCVCLHQERNMVMCVYIRKETWARVCVCVCVCVYIRKEARVCVFTSGKKQGCVCLHQERNMGVCVCLCLHQERSKVVCVYIRKETCFCVFTTYVQLNVMKEGFYTYLQSYDVTMVFPEYGDTD